LDLLEEERRKSGVVFGKECASEITTMVLSEAFRPILSSFQTRLNALCPSKPDSTQSSSNNGSLAAVAGAYQQTLQFISLAYNHLLSDSPTPSHQKQIYKVLTTVASPFANYQIHYPELEEIYATNAASPTIKRIQQASKPPSYSVTRDDDDDENETPPARNNVTRLRDTLSSLRENAPAVFSLVSSSLERYASLNTGYHPRRALTAMNAVLVNHTTELTIGINRLSASVVTNTCSDSRRGVVGGNVSSTSPLSETFDEEVVQNVLEVLITAGLFKRGLRDLEMRTMETLKALCGRMMTWFEVNDLIMEEEAMRELNVSDAEDMLARHVLCDADNPKMKESCIVELQILTGAAVSPPPDADGSEMTVAGHGNSNGGMESSSSLFQNTHNVFRGLAHACHTFVFDVCASIPMASLSLMTGMTVWKDVPEDEDDEDDDVGENKYSILPQQYITQIGEHMLALVQALEPFASDKSSLELANEVMGGGVKESVSLRYWMELMNGVSLDVDGDALPKRLLHGRDLGNAATALLPPQYAPEDDDDDEAESPATLFCNEWLDVISTAITGKLLERIVRIPRLSKKGCRHLSADLNYLANVLTALGVVGHPHPILGYVEKLVSLKEEELVALLAKETMPTSASASSVGGDDDVEKFVKALERRIARMRGLRY